MSDAGTSTPRRLVSTQQLNEGLATQLLDSAEQLAGEPSPRLKDVVIANLFMEPSTRTRASFDLATRQLGAQVLTLTEGEASMQKGESLEDTGLTLQALGARAIVIRHPAPGAAARLADVLRIPVVNAGDGANDHPTQALVDAFTLRQRFGRIEGLKVVIAGDIRYGRGARANIVLLQTLGAEVTLVSPNALRPQGETGRARISDDLDAAIADCDAVLLQRVQRERHRRVKFCRGSFARRYGLTPARAKTMLPHAVVMHPGPMNRGVEISSEVADGPRSLIQRQAANGVPVRMAVLRWILEEDCGNR